jgi:hypothetical protein
MHGLMDCWLLTSTDTGITWSVSHLTAFFLPRLLLQPLLVYDVMSSPQENDNLISHLLGKQVSSSEHHERGMERQVAHDDTVQWSWHSDRDRAALDARLCAPWWQPDPNVRRLLQRRPCEGV